VSAVTRRRLGLGFWSFVLLMAALTALFAWLGQWQMHRLGEKEALIAAVAARLEQPAVALPPATEWATLDAEDWAYRPVSVTGSYLAQPPVAVFTNLSPARGPAGGPGYWLMAPFAPEGGGIVFVNRGFVPQAAAGPYRAMLPPEGPQSLTGIALRAEGIDSFTPAPDAANRIEWVRNPARLAALAGTAPPLLDLTIDLPAGAAGELPQGGETVVEFPNNHLGYALTWFGFALLTPGLLAYWVWRQRRPTA
jgi:surfeit locus 1 family protein